MIEAGVRIFRLADIYVMSLSEDENIIVEKIYAAMEKARLSTSV